MKVPYALLLLLPALASAEAANQITPSDKQLALVREKVADTLKDPDSAKFKDFAASAIDAPGQPRKIWICGRINAKNSYGGMAGYEPFVALLSENDVGLGLVYSQIAEDEATRASVLDACADAMVAF